MKAKIISRFIVLFTSSLSLFMVAEAAPFLDPALKSREALVEYLEKHPAFVKGIQERINEASGYSDGMKAELLTLDLRDFAKAVADHFPFLRKLYCEDVVSEVVRKKIRELHAKIYESGINGYSGACRIDGAGDLVFHATIAKEKDFYPVFEKLSKIDALVDFLGGTRFEIEVVGDFVLDGTDK